MEIISQGNFLVFSKNTKGCSLKLCNKIKQLYKQAICFIVSVQLCKAELISNYSKSFTEEDFIRKA